MVIRVSTLLLFIIPAKTVTMFIYLGCQVTPCRRHVGAKFHYVSGSYPKVDQELGAPLAIEFPNTDQEVGVENQTIETICAPNVLVMTERAEGLVFDYNHEDPGTLSSSGTAEDEIPSSWSSTLAVAGSPPRNDVILSELETQPIFEQMKAEVVTPAKDSQEDGNCSAEEMKENT